MIILGNKRWFQLILILRGTPLERIWKRLAVVTAVAVAVTLLHDNYGLLQGGGLTTLPFSLIALALGIFLGFRNNTSYDRFWEGRKLWGSLVNTSRTLTRRIMTLVGPQPGQSVDPGELSLIHRELVHRLVAYVHSFRHHLRDETDLQDAEPFLPADEFSGLAAESNVPVAILHRLGERFRDMWQQGLVHPMHLPALEGGLTDLTDIQGGCERIKSTPIPASYTVLIHRLVASYVFALPFGIVDSIGLFTPAVTTLVAYAFLGLDAIGDEIEQPFGTELNDLPLATLSRMIEINVRQRIDDSDIPAGLEPDDGVLQ